MSQPADELNVWYLLDDGSIGPAELRRYYALLNDEERARYQRYRVDSARRQFLIARALVRSTLSRYVSTRPDEWTFASNRYGRPEIASPQLPRALRFNLSHTSGLLSCAVAWEHDVGVDVEWINRRTGGVHLARRFFSQAEVADLLRVPERRQRDAFFDYWTLKEAYVKARGKGLAIPLGQFSFKLAEGEQPSITFGPELADTPECWQFGQLMPSAEHKLAVAVDRGTGPDVQIHYRRVEQIDV
jgi:4'-phosphopantetheinyl transferase